METQNITKKIEKIIKRDGRIVPFNPEKISAAIFKAAEFVGGSDKELANTLAQEIIQQLEKKYRNKTPNVDNIQELIEKNLIEKGYAKTAKAFILYRYKKNEQQRQRTLILGRQSSTENLSFSNEALSILERRYLLKDEVGNLIETPQGMLRRVAKNVSRADNLYKVPKEKIKENEEAFYRIMADLRFLPNSPTLMNAGTKTQQLSSCIVLPVKDTMEGIFGTLMDAAIVHQRGSGTGFSFSRLRPMGDSVGKNQGVAAGPVTFMQVFDRALEAVKQGGVRPGANMAVLKVDHPDIIRFIESKRDKRTLKNFNISVAVTDNFMKAVEEDRSYYLTNPKIEKYVGKLRAKDVFSVITQNAWKTGDPGLIFIDEINRKHPAKHLGEIETTNQCGEAPLLPYEGCVLGSLNLNKFVDAEKQEVNWSLLKETVKVAVHFLDNVIDMNNYPQKEIEHNTKRTRKFGLGVMGFADFLCQLQVKYDSEQGLEIANRLMAFIKDVAYDTSSKIAEKRGVCPAWKGSDHQKNGRKMRNITCLSIAPTGTISILGGASSGCEPLFAISYQRTLLGDKELVYLNPAFEKVAHQRGFYTPELIKKISRFGSIQEIKEIPKDVRDIFVTAQDIAPEWHVKMQATLQKHVDNSISKTINFPKIASIRDVENAYLLAWKNKCKGITIYRDGSYEEQVLNIGD
tara:strand:- start:809 stop:2869 length:2061 start_codon:yes stop_codon:yes gene_type:complete